METLSGRATEDDDKESKGGGKRNTLETMSELIRLKHTGYLSAVFVCFCRANLEIFRMSGIRGRQQRKRWRGWKGEEKKAPKKKRQCQFQDE